MGEADREQVGAWKRELWGEDDFEDPGEVVFVWDDGSLGGFVSVALRPWADGCEGSPVPFVEGWYVAEGLRGRGVGRALIAAAEAWAREGGFDELGSDAEVENLVSLEAHRRLGFEPTERLQYFRKALVGDVPELVVEEHVGDRARLRPLFAEAEDSDVELDGYLDAGRVLIARRGDDVVGHLQLVDDEIKNMAVRADQRRRGVGRRLMDAAVEMARGEGHSALRVATATADVDNLRFYQRLGFRLRSVDRDAFTEATGYAPGLTIDGIELRDRVWLDREL